MLYLPSLFCVFLLFLQKQQQQPHKKDSIVAINNNWIFCGCCFVFCLFVGRMKTAK